jgi:hypothetical protein
MVRDVSQVTSGYFALLKVLFPISFSYLMFRCNSFGMSFHITTLTHTDLICLPWMNSLHTGLSLFLITGLYFFSRTLGDAPSAITYYEESAEFLSKLPTKDLEVVF